MVFLHFLHLDHVVSVIDPNDVYDIAFEAHRGFELHAGLHKAAITGY
ncbi:Uncharacterised protein [Vibrio cholerae]|nr:Uncharacterised protein [Vibrio cholerae]